MRDCGYKEYIIDDTVLEDKDGFYIGGGYEETDTQIIQIQKYFEVVDEPEYTENEFEEWVEGDTKETVEE